MTIQVGSQLLGRLDLVLYDETMPKTVANFCNFLREPKVGSGYRQCNFHRIIRGFMAQGGDFTKGDGTGCTSIYGEQFPDENFRHEHSREGILSMANSGKDTNGSQFFITFRATPHLNGKHVVFGHVDMSIPSSQKVLKALEKVATGDNDCPLEPTTIIDCGVVEDVKEGDDDNEIDLEDELPQEERNPVEKDETEADLLVVADQADDEVEDEEPPKTKADALKQRLRKLKLKMNQARQLNKQEVLREGERLGSVEGAAKARKRQMTQDKKLKEAEWKARNAKALEIAKAHGVDGKHLVEQADASLKKSYRKEERAKANLFEMNDYYNPEGQHRNYERNLKSLPHAAGPLLPTEDTLATFNPILGTSDETREREGARNLAIEMKRRIEKQKAKRDRVEFEQEDVSYINQRNKRFNQKLSRTFDKHTAEIRQNLERGTAL